MNVCVFIPDDNKHHRKALEAFAEGCGGEVLPVDVYRECDIAVVFGMPKRAVHRSRERGEIIRQQQERGRDFILIDSGYVKRDDYYMVGLNGLNGRADFRNRDMPGDRWAALNMDLRSWREDGDYILICGQVPWDASVQHSDHIDWCRRVMQDIEGITDRPMRFRPHPLAKLNYGVLCPVSKAGLNEDLAGAWVVVTFNSNTAVDAAITGVPVFVADEGSMALAIANRDLRAIENPVTPERDQWARDLAYAQWTLGEMVAGLPWQHLTRDR